VFLRDRQLGLTERVSVDSAAAQCERRQTTFLRSRATAATSRLWSKQRHEPRARRHQRARLHLSSTDRTLRHDRGVSVDSRVRRWNGHSGDQMLSISPTALRSVHEPGHQPRPGTRTGAGRLVRRPPAVPSTEGAT
jgi:hypothetical protein